MGGSLTNKQAIHVYVTLVGLDIPSGNPHSAYSDCCPPPHEPVLTPLAPQSAIPMDTSASSPRPVGPLRVRGTAPLLVYPCAVCVPRSSGRMQCFQEGAPSSCWHHSSFSRLRHSALVFVGEPSERSEASCVAPPMRIRAGTLRVGSG